MIKSIRNSFITGLLLLAPLGVTMLVINMLIANIGAPASDLFFKDFIPPDIFQKDWVEYLAKVLSTFFVIIFITIFGYLSQYFFGKFAVRFAERIIGRLPFINTVYSTVKQIVDTFSKQKKAVFQKTVLVEYPRKGIYSLGFLTGDLQGEVKEKVERDLVNVFIPTTPNPTSGFLLLIPREDVIILDMPIGDGMKMIISGGAVIPPYNIRDNG
jgi:uncharacterized membrane protein